MVCREVILGSFREVAAHLRFLELLLYMVAAAVMALNLAARLSGAAVAEVVVLRLLLPVEFHLMLVLAGLGTIQQMALQARHPLVVAAQLERVRHLVLALRARSS